MAASMVYDSEAAWEEKALHLENATSLEASNTVYREGASNSGGISLNPTSATINGDVATIIYDVYFGDEPVYTGLGNHRVDGVWVVTEEDFCSWRRRAPCSRPQLLKGSPSLLQGSRRHSRRRGLVAASDSAGGVTLKRALLRLQSRSATTEARTHDERGHLTKTHRGVVARS